MLCMQGVDGSDVVNTLGDLGVLLRGLPIGGGEFESVMTRDVVNLLDAGKGVMWVPVFMCHIGFCLLQASHLPLLYAIKSPLARRQPWQSKTKIP